MSLGVEKVESNQSNQGLARRGLEPLSQSRHRPEEPSQETFPLHESIVGFRRERPGALVPSRRYKPAVWPTWHTSADLSSEL